MSPTDAKSLAQLAIRLNLITEDNCLECQDELEPGNETPIALARVLERKA